MAGIRAVATCTRRFRSYHDFGSAASDLPSMYRTSRTIRLLSRARKGSRSGLGELLESYRPLLRRMAQDGIGTRLRNRLSESDLVQETMLTASRRFDGFRGSSEPEFRRWLKRVFQSRLTDGLRYHLVAEKRRRCQECLSDEIAATDGANSPSDAAAIAEESQILLQAIIDLDPVDRVIVLARYVDQWSFDRIAQELNMPLATVWRRWNRALERLRRRFAVGEQESIHAADTRSPRSPIPR